MRNARGWKAVEVVTADALASESLAKALEGVDVAFYLVHSMSLGADFARLASRPVTPLGKFELKGVAAPEDVFAPLDGTALHSTPPKPAP